MNLTATDLGILDQSIEAQKIRYYLFGNLKQDSGKTSDYLNAVNAIYSTVRQR